MNEKKMTVYGKENFNREFPESYPWDQVRQLKLSAVGEKISEVIIKNYHVGNRDLIPGMREALRIIACYAEVE